MTDPRRYPTWLAELMPCEQVRVDLFDCHDHDQVEQHLGSISFPYMTEQEIGSRAPEMAARAWNLVCQVLELSTLGVCMAISDGCGDQPLHGQHDLSDDPRYASLWTEYDSLYDTASNDEGTLTMRPIDVAPWV